MPIDSDTIQRSPQTFVERFGPRAARIRGRVHGRIGTHAYRVFHVVTEWAGGEPGRGDSKETRVELYCGRGLCGRLVPPSVEDAVGYAAKHRFSEVGIIEDGSVIVSEISDVALPEAKLVDFSRLLPGESSLFEIVQDDRDGGGIDQPVRRMALDGAPQHDVQGCQWIIKLRPHSGFSQPFGQRERPL